MFPVVALVLILIAVILGILGNIRQDIKTLMAAVISILAGAVTDIGVLHLKVFFKFNREEICKKHIYLARSLHLFGQTYRTFYHTAVAEKINNTCLNGETVQKCDSETCFKKWYEIGK